MYDSDHWHRYVWSQEQRVLLSIIDNHPRRGGMRLLDFACGTGRITCFLAPHLHEAIGVDVSAEMLTRAKAKGSRARFVNANLIENNIFQDNSFQFVTAFRFFVNAEPELRRNALRVLVSLLAEDGLLVMNNHQNYDSVYLRIARWHAKFRKRPLKMNMLSLKDCSSMLSEAGLEIVRVYPIGLAHLPKLNFYHFVYRLLDFGLGWCQPAVARAENLIFVCRRKPLM